MRRWILTVMAVAMPFLSGCCWNCGTRCGYRLFHRPCMFGPCADGGCGVGCGAGCGTGCGAGNVGYGYGANYNSAPVAPPYLGGTGAPPAAMPAGPVGPPIDKLSAVPTAKTVPTRVLR